jgi:GT2 family glycosyltransferase
MHDLSQPVAIIIPTLDAQRAEPVAAAALASAGHPARVIVVDGPARGFTRTVNAGLQQLRAGEDACLLNDDTGEFSQDWLRRLVAALYSAPDYGIVGPRKLKAAPYTGTRVTKFVWFWAALIRHAVIQQLGFLDERFVHYDSDTEYCQRARRAGWRLARVGEVSIRHTGHASSAIGEQWRAGDKAAWRSL